jgi:hypothetical protein
MRLAYSIAALSYGWCAPLLGNRWKTYPELSTGGYSVLFLMLPLQRMLKRLQRQASHCHLRHLVNKSSLLQQRQMQLRAHLQHQQQQLLVSLLPQQHWRQPPQPPSPWTLMQQALPLQPRLLLLPPLLRLVSRQLHQSKLQLKLSQQRMAWMWTCKHNRQQQLSLLPLLMLGLMQQQQQHLISQQRQQMRWQQQHLLQPLAPLQLVVPLPLSPQLPSWQRSARGSWSGSGSSRRMHGCLWSPSVHLLRRCSRWWHAALRRLMSR